MHRNKKPTAILLPHPVAIVRWRDAAWHMEEARPDEPGLVCTTVGQLMRRDKDHAYLAFDWSEEDDSYRHGISIPTPLIIEIVILQEARNP